MCLYASSGVVLKNKVEHKGLKRSSADWIRRQINDPYVELAKREGYRSRSAYKLIEIQKRFGIIRKSSAVIDLGSSPGGWSQVASQISSDVSAIDILDMQPIAGVNFVKGDFLDPAIQQMFTKKFDVIMSDMSPNTCGIKKVDHIRIMNLVENVFDFARSRLEVGGSVIAKVFQGGAESDLLKVLKKEFSKVSHMKPKASRKESSETYIISIGFCG
jgi:23S rRNA (uridine2552-2'-O)-methyltransferase